MRHYNMGTLYSLPWWREEVCVGGINAWAMRARQRVEFF